MSVFAWQGPLLTVDLPGATARFSGRAAGDLARYSQDGADRHRRVAANMASVAEAVAIPVSRWAQQRQVHGTVVRRVGAGQTLAADSADATADGQVIAAPGVAGVVLTADCLAVVVAAGGVVAVLHAGWRGLADGVLEEGARALHELGATGEVHAAIGPGAGGCCYEVGPEVREAFADDGVLAREGAHRIDLKAIAARRLHAAGVAVVHDCELCTMCSTDDAGERLFFSHRADGAGAGRQAGIAWLS